MKEKKQRMLFAIFQPGYCGVFFVLTQISDIFLPQMHQGL